jgi:hypothetical protein
MDNVRQDQEEIAVAPSVGESEVQWGIRLVAPSSSLQAGLIFGMTYINSTAWRCWSRGVIRSIVI